MNDSYINIPVKTETFIELVDFLRDEGSDRDPVETVEMAIVYWMGNAAMKPEDLLPEVTNNEMGYKWKQVFLPHATTIRMKYKGTYYYAKVQGDQVIYEGKSMTPSEFANKVANSSRNAWRDLEIKRPRDNGYVSANTVRQGSANLDKTIDKWLEEVRPK